MSSLKSLGPRIAVLKEGGERQQGVDHIVSNAKACSSIADIIKVTLGPLGDDIILVVKGKFFLIFPLYFSSYKKVLLL